jgi:hypothetical protein
MQNIGLRVALAVSIGLIVLSTVINVLLLRDRSYAASRVEYVAEVIPEPCPDRTHICAKIVTDFLNKYAANGWELVDVTTTPAAIAIFKK